MNNGNGCVALSPALPQRGRGLVALALLLLAGPCYGAFEDIGAGARPVAMGSAFAAVADDVNTLYYNPAGLGQLRHPQMTAGYGRLYMGLTDGSNLGSGFMGVLVPLRDGNAGTLGLGALNLQLQGAYSEDAYYASYGRKIAGSLYGGASLKLLRRSYGSDAYTQIDPLFQNHKRSMSTTSLDLGLLYRVSPYVVLSAGLRDATEPDVGLAANDKVPRSLVFGAAYYQRAFVVGGMLKRKDKDTDLSFGGERWFYRHWVAGRGGFEFGSRNKRNMTLGLGCRLGNAQVDYAFVLPLSGIVDTSGSHRIALTIRFGKVEAGPIALLEQEEILGLASSSYELEKLRRDMERYQEETDSYQRETDRLQGRILELETSIRSLRGGAAPTEGPGVSTGTALSPEDTDMKARIDRLEQELRQQRGEIERRQQVKPVVPGAAAGPFKRPGVYKVLEGDTLQSIAAKTLGDADRWAEIYVANKDRLKRGGAVTAGQTLIIP